MRKEDINLVVGLADCCELAAAVLRFPDERLAEGLSSGAVAADAAACLGDAGVESSAIGGVSEALSRFRGADSEQLFGSLRKGHSLMYLAPGLDVPIWPYEAAFLLKERRPDAAPTLFRSACTLDVERHMREAGVLPKTSRTEPLDSAWDELSFMSFLYGSLAAALHEGRGDDAMIWRGRVDAFWREHVSKWLPAFMERTVEVAPTLSYGAEYAQLAAYGSAALAAVAADVERPEESGGMI